MKKALALTLIAILLAACAPAPSSDDTAVQTAVAALLTQQAPAPADATQAPAEEAPVDTGNSNAGSAMPTAESIPGLPAEASCVPLGTARSVGMVVEVYTGDSILVRIDGVDYGVRYIGIDDGDSPQSTEANRALVENQQVVLVADEGDTDEYGRYLRYVIVGETFVNLHLLQQGNAWASPEAPNSACERLFNSIP